MKTVAAVALIAVSGMAGCGTRPVEVSRAEFLAKGKVWPLSVESGQVGCSTEPRGEARWFRAPDGKLYSLNGFATPEAGYADLTPIWLDDRARLRQLQEAFPDQPVTMPVRLSIGDLSDEAAKAC